MKGGGERSLAKVSRKPGAELINTASSPPTPSLSEVLGSADKNKGLPVLMLRPLLARRLHSEAAITKASLLTDRQLSKAFMVGALAWDLQLDSDYKGACEWASDYTLENAREVSLSFSVSRCLCLCLSLSIFFLVAFFFYYFYYIFYSFKKTFKIFYLYIYLVQGLTYTA